MKSLIKSSLFIGMSLMLALLTERRLRRDRESANEIDVQPAQPESAAPAIDKDPVPTLPDVKPRPVSATTVIFSGRLMRNGEQFVLREIAGTLYPLESVGRALSYEGEDVRVTGKLDLSTRRLQVDAIEAAVL